MAVAVLTALIASVGTTAEPIIYAVEKAHKEGRLALFLVYGHAFPGQEPNPFDVVREVTGKSEKLGVRPAVFELPEPEDLDNSIRLFRTVMASACGLGADRILLDFTGGTKVMAAAMGYAALSQSWGCEAVFEYVGGSRNGTGRVKDMTVIRSPNTVVQEAAANTVQALREHNFSRAALLSDNLLKRGRTEFLKKATAILHHWDGFHYEAAAPLLKECGPQARILIDDWQYGALSDTVVRLGNAMGRIQLAILGLKQLKEGKDQTMSPAAAEGHFYILGDTIENARRRVQTNPMDCVLRCYRATEVVVQTALISHKINPWHPQWRSLSPEKLSAYTAALRSGQLPNEISLWTGLLLLEHLTTPLEPGVKDELKELGSVRNYSYLEHGYDSVSAADAAKMLAKMENIVVAIASRSQNKIEPLQHAEAMRLKA